MLYCNKPVTLALGSRLVCFFALRGMFRRVALNQLLSCCTVSLLYTVYLRIPLLNTYLYSIVNTKVATHSYTHFGSLHEDGVQGIRLADVLRVGGAMVASYTEHLSQEYCIFLMLTPSLNAAPVQCHILNHLLLHMFTIITPPLICF